MRKINLPITIEEYQKILFLTKCGKTNREIAEQLDLTIAAIKKIKSGKNLKRFNI